VQFEVSAEATVSEALAADAERVGRIRVKMALTTAEACQPLAELQVCRRSEIIVACPSASALLSSLLVSTVILSPSLSLQCSSLPCTPSAAGRVNRWS